MRNRDLPAFPCDKDAPDYAIGLTKLEYAVIQLFANNDLNAETTLEQVNMLFDQLDGVGK